MTDNPDNKVRVIPCDSWDKFVTEIRKPVTMPRNDGVCRAGNGAIFRGHADTSWKLSSTIERNMKFTGTAKDPEGNDIPHYSLKQNYGEEYYEKMCENILSRFREFSKGMPGIDHTVSDLELWTIGRHYNLLSPYLDWTRSPYIAAFFAFENIYNGFKYLQSSYLTIPEIKVVHVWGYRIWDLLPDEKDSNLEIIPTKNFHTSRARSQQGWFTKLRTAKYTDIESYLLSIGKAYYLERYEINTEAAMDALNDLTLMNINYLSLFPDSFGAALHSNINTSQFGETLHTREMFKDVK